MIKLLYVFIGGGIGSVARLILSGSFCQLMSSKFPFGTVAVNLVGCFLIGLIVVISEEKFLLSENLRVLIIIGFLGGFTTFSTFIFETANLIKDGESIKALLNVIISVGLGFILFRFGVLLGKVL